MSILVLLFLVPISSAALLPLGSACTANSGGYQCTSGFCAPQAVCCNSPCRGVCRSCNATGYCLYAASETDPNSDCDDGNLCNGIEACDGSGGCTRSENTTEMCPANATETDSCAVVFCDSVNQICTFRTNPLIGKPCGQSNVGSCTRGTYSCACNQSCSITCIDSTGPVDQGPNTGPTDVACNGVVNGTTPHACTSTAQCQTPFSSTCLRVTCVSGYCTYTARNVGKSCVPSQSPCWGTGICDFSGACITVDEPCESSDLSFDDTTSMTNHCVIGICNATGCYSTPYSGPCDDGNPCTAGDTCNGTGQCLGTPLDCDDGNPCTVDSCNATAIPDGPDNSINYCYHDPAPLEGDACTLIPVSSAWSGICTSGTCVGK